VATIRQLNRAIGDLDQELEQRTPQVAPALLDLPGCAGVTAAKLLAEIGPIDRFKTMDCWREPLERRNRRGGFVVRVRNSAGLLRPRGCWPAGLRAHRTRARPSGCTLLPRTAAALELIGRPSRSIP
jgi:hypothetical protein